jgi:PAS domain S-box-containing protein
MNLRISSLVGLLMENHPVAVVLTNTAMGEGKNGPHIEYANQAFYQMSGYHAEEVVGQTPRMFQGPRTNRTLLSRLKRSLLAGKAGRVQVINYRKNGEPYWCDISAWPLCDTQGNVLHYIGFEREIIRQPGRPSRQTRDPEWWIPGLNAPQMAGFRAVL